MGDDHVQQIHRENPWLRELLTAVAEDLEHVAGLGEIPEYRSILEVRAMRVRQRLREGPPQAVLRQQEIGRIRAAVDR